MLRRILLMLLLFVYGMGPQGFSLWGHASLHEKGPCQTSKGSCGSLRAADCPGGTNAPSRGGPTNASPHADPPGSSDAQSQLPNDGFDHAPCWICQALATGTLHFAGDAPLAGHICVANITPVAQPSVFLSSLDFDSHSPRGPPLS